MAAHALLVEAVLEAVENLALAGQEAALQHRGFRDGILVALFHGLADRSRCVSDLEAYIPEGHQRLADDFLHLFVRSIFILQEKNIHIAHWGEFATAVASKGRDRQATGEGFFRHATHDIIEKLAEQDIDHVRALTGNLTPTATGIVPGAQALLLLLAEVFKKNDRVVVSGTGTLGEFEGGFFERVRFGRLTHGAGGRITISTRRLICCSSMLPVADATSRDSPKPRVSMESAGIPIEEISHSFTVCARSSLRRRL